MGGNSYRDSSLWQYIEREQSKEQSAETYLHNTCDLTPFLIP